MNNKKENEQLKNRVKEIHKELLQMGGKDVNFAFLSEAGAVINGSGPRIVAYILFSMIRYPDFSNIVIKAVSKFAEMSDEEKSILAKIDLVDEYYVTSNVDRSNGDSNDEAKTHK